MSGSGKQQTRYGGKTSGAFCSLMSHKTTRRAVRRVCRTTPRTGLDRIFATSRPLNMCLWIRYGHEYARYKVAMWVCEIDERRIVKRLRAYLGAYLDQTGSTPRFGIVWGRRYGARRWWMVSSSATLDAKKERRRAKKDVIQGSRQGLPILPGCHLGYLWVFLGGRCRRRGPPSWGCTLPGASHTLAAASPARPTFLNFIFLDDGFCGLRRNRKRSRRPGRYLGRDLGRLGYLGSSNRLVTRRMQTILQFSPYDHARGRNVWKKGGVVAASLADWPASRRTLICKPVVGLVIWTGPV